jgi:hypothetical protein
MSKQKPRLASPYNPLAIPGQVIGGFLSGFNPATNERNRREDKGAGYRSTAAQDALANKGYDTRDALRQQEIDLLMQQVGSAEQDITDFEARQADDRALRKFTAGRALSAMMPGSSLNSSGAYLQAINQGAMDVAQQEIAQRQQADRELRQLKDRAMEQRLGTVRRQAEVGSREMDKGPAYSKGMGMIENSITANSNIWGGLRGDNTKQMFTEAATIINQIRQESPDAADALVAEYLTPGGKGYTRIRNMEGQDKDLPPEAYLANIATV